MMDLTDVDLFRAPSMWDGVYINSDYLMGSVRTDSILCRQHPVSPLCIVDLIGF